MKILPPFDQLTTKQTVFGLGTNTLSSLSIGLHFIFEFLIIIQLGLPFSFIIFHFLGVTVGSFITIKIISNWNQLRSYVIIGGIFVALLIGFTWLNQAWLAWTVPLYLFGLGICIGSFYGIYVPMTTYVLEQPQFTGRKYGLSFLVQYFLVILHAGMSVFLGIWVFPIYLTILFILFVVIVLYGRGDIKIPSQKPLNIRKYIKQRENLPKISLAFFVGFFTTNTYYVAVLILELQSALADLFIFVIVLFVTAAITMPLCGVMLDSLGRRFTILLGTSVQALAFLLLGFVEINLTMLLYIFPIVLGIGFAMIEVGGYLSFAELPEREYLRDNSNLFMAILGLGCVGGAIVGEVFRGVIVIEPAYLTIMLLFIFILATLSISQLKETLPSKDELEWRACVQHLFVIHENGVCLKEHPFIDQNLIDRDLISGALTGVIALIQEMTKSRDKLDVLSQKESKMIIKYGKYTITALLSTKDLKILHKKLEDFVGEFEDIFHDVLVPWTGNIELFKPADRLILRCFQ